MIQKENTTVTASYRGYTYQVPAQTEWDELFKIKQLTLSLGEQTITSGSASSHFFVNAKEKEELPIFLYIASEDHSSDGLCPSIRFVLYREGVPLPLFQLGGHQDNTGVIWLPGTISTRTLLPGNYFLLGINAYEDGDEHNFDLVDQRLCFPFCIFPHGNELVHPAIGKATLIRPQHAVEVGKYTSGTLRLSLSFSTPLSQRGEISVSCYSPDWALICNNSRIHGKHSSMHNLSFQLPNEKIWMEGEYRMIVSHNREPYALLRFYYEGASATSAECEPLTSADNEYWIAKQLETDSKYQWQPFCSTPGLRSEKLRMVTLSRRNEYFHLCSSHDLNLPRENSCYRISLPDNVEGSRLPYQLHHLLKIGSNDFSRLDCSTLITMEEQDLEEFIENQSDKTLALYNLPTLLSPIGLSLRQCLEKHLKVSARFWALMLCGTQQEQEELARLAPELTAYCTPEHHIVVNAPSMAEQVHILQACIAEKGFHLSPQAECSLAEQVIEEWKDSSLPDWSKMDCMHFITSDLLLQLQRRQQAAYNPLHEPDKKELTLIQPEDIQLKSYLQRLQKQVEEKACEDNCSQAFNESMKALNAMVGLSALKEKLHKTFMQMRFNEQRRKLGLPAEADEVHHMIFTGNPGTGKTTVAKLIGKIYHSLGLLSKGEVIVTERSKLVGRYIGQTEENMQNVLKEAQGNVLFIDEAYTLCDTLEDRKDFGNHVIESLLTLLADPHPDMLVILAGYDNEMQRLMQMNQGLSGRFPLHYHFADYNQEELMEIAHRFLEERVFSLTDDAEELLSQTVSSALQNKDLNFSNARWIKQLFTASVFPAMACRVMQSNSPMDINLFRTIEQCDIQSAIEQQQQHTKVIQLPRRRIGFIA